MRFLKAAIRPLILILALVLASAATAAASPSGPSLRGPGGASSYWVVTKTGKVCASGKARAYGNGRGAVVGIRGTSDGRGYWLVLRDGKTQPFGDAKQQRYRSAKLIRWSRRLGACKDNVVGAAVADIKTPGGSKPKPPTKTPPSRTIKTTTTPTTPAVTTTTTPLGGGAPSNASTTPADVTTSDGGPPDTTTTTPPPVTTTTQTTPPPITKTTTPPTFPTITTTSVPDAEAGVSYKTTFLATGGAGGDSWTKISGGFPPGLTFNANGKLSGTPTQAGSYAFNLVVTASDGGSAEQGYSMTVLSPVSAGAQTLPAGEAEIPYNASLSATEGRQPYTWTLTGGNLPNGVQLSSSGAITGTPASSGTYSFTATVSDGLGGVSAGSYSLSVDAQPSIATSELPDPVQTLSYDQQLTTTNGSGSDSWQVTGGALPAGLSLSSSGEITGTPTTPGGYNVTVRVTDALGGTATKTYSGITATWHEDENWSGYTAYGATAYTAVSGTFNIPTLVGGIPQNYATGIWVGIDGADNSTLLQAGVSIGDGAEAGYHAWTEEVPQQLTEQNISGFTVDPGDSVTVTIEETDVATQTWTLTITDNTTGQTYSASQVYTGAGQSAEWIVEAPTDSQGHLISMAPWTGLIDFTNLSASQPMTGLDYMTLSPGFVSGGAMNSLLDSSGFAVTDNEQVPPPLAVSG